MSIESFMTSGVFTVKPTCTVAEAIRLMHEKHVRNLPVVNKKGEFIGLFGLRRLSRLFLPKVVSDLGPHSISDLGFLPDDLMEIDRRWHEIANEPVGNYLEKNKKLLFCTPKTAFPELLALLVKSKDSSLPVIVVKGNSKKLVGMVSAWDVLESVVMGRLVNRNDSGISPAKSE